MPREVHLRLPPQSEPKADRDAELLASKAAAKLGVPRKRIVLARLDKVSFDARRKHRDWQVRLTVFLEGEDLPEEERFDPPEIERPAEDAPHVAVVGCGPAGMFAALDLLEAGVRVTLLERGGDVRARRFPLAELNRGHDVDPESNYCFGEGGAGTYSDGKLYARSGNKKAIRRVLRTLVDHGADPDILSSWRPHVGSNRLPEVVKGIRETILRAGGTVHFHARVEDLILEDGAVVGLSYSDLLAGGGKPVKLAADAVILATGHSAPDALQLAARAGAKLQAKGFALGVRAEHPQPWLDEQQYGGLRAAHDLPASFYELVEQVDERGVYSFCMCPGGWIVPATTGQDRVVVNGMSLSRRDSPFANSGIVVQLEPEDWCGERAEESGIAELVGGAPQSPDEDPMFGVKIQEALERRCREAGGGNQRVPAQRVCDFVDERTSPSLNAMSYRPGAVSRDLSQLLPRGIAERMREGVMAFDMRMPGFASDMGQLLAPETRTSSPVRLARDPVELVAEHREGGRLEGLYPSGEGAGYAGGIVSAAVDGRRVAACVVRRLEERLARS